jgi:hypothetical protein
MTMLSIAGPFIISIGVVNGPDMPGMKPPSEAPGHLGEPVGLLPSLAKVIVGPNVLIHFLKQLLQSLWRLPSKVLTVGLGLSSLIMASMTISLGIVGACALSRRNLWTYA